MFAKTIIESDLFLDMPISARLLYYDMGMRGDDDGFVNSPKRIMRVTGVHDDDLKILVAKGFVIPFESGVIVIRHWKSHNYIRNDRYKPTQYKDEKSLLCEDSNGHYMLICDIAIGVQKQQTSTPLDHHLTTTGLPFGSVDEINSSKDSKSKASINTGAKHAEPTIKTKPEQGADTAAITLLLNDGTEHMVYQSQVAAWARLYPAVDIPQQLRNMKGWIDANPQKRKTKRGINAFINSWLTKTQNTNGHYTSPQTKKQQGGNRASNGGNYQIGGENDPYKNIMSG